MLAADFDPVWDVEWGDILATQWYPATSEWDTANLTRVYTSPNPMFADGELTVIFVDGQAAATEDFDAVECATYTSENDWYITWDFAAPLIGKV